MGEITAQIEKFKVPCQETPTFRVGSPAVDVCRLCTVCAPSVDVAPSLLYKTQSRRECCTFFYVCPDHVCLFSEHLAVTSSLHFLGSPCEQHKQHSYLWGGLTALPETVHRVGRF